MKKSKKVAISAVAVLVIGLGGYGLANEFLNWGGEEDINAIYESVDHLDSMLDIKKSDLKTAEKEAGDIKAKLDTVKGEHDSAKKSIQEAATELEQKAREIAELENQRDANAFEIKVRDNILEGKQKTIEQYYKELAAAAASHAATIQDAQMKLDASEAQIDELERAFDEKAHKVTVMGTQLDALLAHKEQLENDNKTLKAEKDDTQLKLDKALNEVEMLKQHTQSIEERHSK